MKWLSIKKYTPPSGTQVFVRAIKNMKDFSFDRYFVGGIEDFTRIEKLGEWALESSDINPENYLVTHFAIIDAIELE